LASCLQIGDFSECAPNFGTPQVKGGEHVHVSGLVGIDVSTGNLAGSTIQEQTRQALTNCQAVLHAAGAHWKTSSRSAYFGIGRLVAIEP
jgi:enamine deaminase RidA (YjgF/YER057c/UK114 family)